MELKNICHGNSISVRLARLRLRRKRLQGGNRSSPTSYLELYQSWEVRIGKPQSRYRNNTKFLTWSDSCEDNTWLKESGILWNGLFLQFLWLWIVYFQEFPNVLASSSTLTWKKFLLELRFSSLWLSGWDQNVVSAIGRTNLPTALLSQPKIERNK